MQPAFRETGIEAEVADTGDTADGGNAASNTACAALPAKRSRERKHGRDWQRRPWPKSAATHDDLLEGSGRRISRGQSPLYGANPVHCGASVGFVCLGVARASLQGPGRNRNINGSMPFKRALLAPFHAIRDAFSAFSSSYNPTNRRGSERAILVSLSSRELPALKVSRQFTAVGRIRKFFRMSAMERSAWARSMWRLANAIRDSPPRASRFLSPSIFF